ncbi:MAG: PhoH family protein [Bacteriovoracaceae bacterium]|nr:PhoH family protein [Bacteriovoracaceae bacterium]
MKKTFVLDTSVLLFDPYSIFKFSNHKVCIPLIVIEELDRFKKDQNENGRNAREFSRLVDTLRAKGSLAKGVELENKGLLFVLSGKEFGGRTALGLDFKTNDNIILATALTLKERGDKVILISKDINMRLKSDALEIDADDYGKANITLKELYLGHRTLEIAEERLSEFEANRFLHLSIDEQKQMNPNEYFILQDKNNSHRKLYGRYSLKKGGIVPLIKNREGVWGIHPRNPEQQFACDALLNDEVHLVTLVGKAGTGKTLMAIAAGLEMAINSQKYSRVLVSRPVWPMGKDIGFLPGDISEKLGPWMQPIFDNIDFLFGNARIQSGRKQVGGSWEDLINEGLLHVEPLTYIRGRSLPGQYMIVDEAQNLTPHEVKTIITRAGEGTKIVLTGDCEQIDNPYLDSINNGLAYCMERLKGEDLIAHTTLQIGERSKLSEIATKLL